MLDSFFDEFISLSAELREEYPLSLGKKTDNWEELFHLIDDTIPSIFQVIYSKVSGTKRGIQKQELMDFLPGYRLIHICELVDEYSIFKKNFNCNSNNVQKVIPLLTNYSSDFICYCKMADGSESVVSIMHDDQDLVLIHKSIDKFMKTICEFYRNAVYFLDSDGYLDYDMEKEGVIGSKINKGIPYWVE